MWVMSPQRPQSAMGIRCRLMTQRRHVPTLIVASPAPALATARPPAVHDDAMRRSAVTAGALGALLPCEVQNTVFEAIL